jgi:selenocysteine lyase/cysteine desulfurase
LKVDKDAYKLQPGGPGYELVYATTAVIPYLLSLSPENNLTASFKAIAEHEQTLSEPLLKYLLSEYDRGVRIVGDEKAGLGRVPTISFVVVGQRSIKSKDIVAVFDKHGDVSC